MILYHSLYELRLSYLFELSASKISLLSYDRLLIALTF
ncbi:hypothetical protein HPHPH29_0618 [Helicobacter pylori Hp H-29]|nr:hypothetical protein HPHPH29_0618 [Helicobacter pylori Hp H-29]